MPGLSMTSAYVAFAKSSHSGDATPRAAVEVYNSPGLHYEIAGAL